MDCIDASKVLNLHYMFLGENPVWWFLLEIVFRTSFLYFYTYFNFRFLGKRSMAQLTAFEFIIVIALGSAVGDPMFYPAIPLLYAMIVISMIVLLDTLFAIITRDNVWLDKFFSGSATVLVENGEINESNLKKQRLSHEDLFIRLRLQGISDVGQVEYAFLEISGQLSVFRLPLEKQREVHSTLEYVLEGRCVKTELADKKK